MSDKPPMFNVERTETIKPLALADEVRANPLLSITVERGTGGRSRGR
jgi:hypothetical protein